MPSIAGRHWTLGVLFYWARRYPEAIRHFRQMDEVFPGFQPAQALLALSLLKDRQYRAAVESADRMAEAPDPTSRFALVPGFVYAMAGERERAARFVRLWQDRARGHWVNPLGLALLNHALGEDQRAAQRLQEAVAEGDPWLVFFQLDPTFESLRGSRKSVVGESADPGS